MLSVAELFDEVPWLTPQPIVFSFSSTRTLIRALPVAYPILELPLWMHTLISLYHLLLTFLVVQDRQNLLLDLVHGERRINDDVKAL
jgi:hypothetical protein